MVFKFIAKIRYKEGIIDPEQKTILKVLKRSGYKINSLEFKKEVDFEIEANNKEQAINIANEIVDNTLSNPVLETFEIKLVDTLK